MEDDEAVADLALMLAERLVDRKPKVLTKVRLVPPATYLDNTIS